MSLETQGKINEDPSGSFFFIQIHLSMLILETDMSSGYLYFYDTEFHNFLSSEVGAFRHKGGRFKDLTLGDKLQAVGNTAHDFMTYGGLNSIIAKYVGKDYDMSRSISFFLEPIPDDIAKLFNNKHAYWQSGKKLYEYKVELSTWIQRILETGTFPYRVTGSQEVRDLVFNKQDWGSVADAKDAYKYEKEILSLEKKLDYYGIWGVGIKKAIDRASREGIKKSIETSVKILTEAGRETELYKEKAPWIPNLVIFPGFKPVSYDDYREIILK